MCRGVWLLVVGLLAAAVGVGAAHAGGTGTTTTATTTTTTTTPSYAPLAPSSLPPGCVGAGAAALVPLAHPVIALGTPASNLGPSVYASSGTVLTFDSSTSSGSTCKSQQVTLNSVSLFGGAVSASRVEARDGKGKVTGLEIDGAPVTVPARETVPVDDWGQLTLGTTAGRVSAPLVLQLLQAHDGLSAGTAVAVAFAASAQPVAKPTSERVRQQHTQQKPANGSSRSRNHAAGTLARKRQPTKPPPDYPGSRFPFVLGGGLVPGKKNSVVSTAMRYLGIRYQWGGARPSTGFDCSGLVQYVFGKLGVWLPHYTVAQWNSPDAVAVPANQLQPGNLVFFTGSDGTRKAPGHVGIYVGDGYLIDAPHTGSVVRIDSLNEHLFADEYVGARRIVGTPLDARHLVNVTKDTGPAPTVPWVLAERMTRPASGESLPLIGTVRTTALVSPSRNYGLWAGVGLGGVLLLFSAGVVPYRRRRRAPETGPSTDTTN